MNLRCPAKAMNQVPADVVVFPKGLSGYLVRSVLDAFARIQRGVLHLQYPDGAIAEFGEPESGPRVHLRLHSWNGLLRLAQSGSVGAGEGYTAGDWDCDNLPGLVELFCINEEALSPSSNLRTLLHRLSHWANRNSVVGARKNIHAHYDIGNDFYQCFLDRSMTYSCALFEHPEDDLETAQTAKYRKIAELARLTPGMSILEIGCGWGGFAEFAAREHHCKVAAISLSQEQLAYAQAHARQEGLNDLIDYRFIDYRDLTGRFDRIVSIEMIEAVGHTFLDGFFAKCEELLAPEGLLVLQSIIIPDQRYDTYRSNPDWIQKYIFPGGHLPCLGSLLQAARRRSQLVVESVGNIGIHYAETLRRWRRQMLDSRDRILAQGYPTEFLRTWEYYLAYCEGAFASRYLQDLLILMTRPMNQSMPTWPYTPDPFTSSRLRGFQENIPETTPTLPLHSPSFHPENECIHLP
ncbi:MAG: cyclopropane-fatty-acyl-phospholipid synthase [Verrucomicrobiota bacterium]|nr:cyclopropane-fatty-acyl-phospholipid synthase [Verrucomicrobiota bacterium]